MPNMPTSFAELKRSKLLELRDKQARNSQLKTVDPFTTLGFVPNPGPQTAFLEADEQDILYGGAAGGSKSTSLLMYGLRACAQYPGLQAFWFRRSFPELEHSVLRMLGRWRYGRTLGASYNRQAHELTFANGSILTFAHAKNLEEATAYQSAEINLLLIDERTTIPPDVIDMLYTRVRSGVAGVPCLGIRSATNPGNIGHSRVLTDYVEATDYGRKVIVDGSGRSRRFIQARASDTPQLGEDYVKSLAGLPEHLRRAFLDGDWTVFQGQVFAEWRYDRHTVEPFDVPDMWQKYAGMDWGFTAPFAVVWAALDEDRRLWVYRDMSAKQLTAERQAQEVLSAESTSRADWNIIRFRDPATKQRNGAGTSVAEAWAQAGLVTVDAPNDRVSGWQTVHHWLADGPACRLHQELGWTMCPKLHVMRNCIEVIRTIPALPYRTLGNVEDADTQADDHIPDALRYLVAGMSGAAPEPQIATAPKDRWDTAGLSSSPLAMEW
jgi:phage terminase large subunit